MTKHSCMAHVQDVVMAQEWKYPTLPEKFDESFRGNIEAGSCSMHTNLPAKGEGRNHERRRTYEVAIVYTRVCHVQGSVKFVVLEWRVRMDG